MKRFAAQISELANNASLMIKNIPDEKFDHKPTENKWSKKEILGHLIDSAFNNHRRFVAGQTDTIPKIYYHQDEWVGVQHYQSIPKISLIQFWWMLNIHIAHVLEMMHEDVYFRECDSGKDDAELRTLHWLAEDYIKHMKHHLTQILEP